MDAKSKFALDLEGGDGGKCGIICTEKWLMLFADQAYLLSYLKEPGSRGDGENEIPDREAWP